MITADHGNAEIMVKNDGSPMTAHTTDPVPFIVVGAAVELHPGRLADIAPHHPGRDGPGLPAGNGRQEPHRAVISLCIMQNGIRLFDGYRFPYSGKDAFPQRRMYRMELRQIAPADRDPALVAALLAVWEASVRATHHFLSDAAIRQIAGYVPQALGEGPPAGGGL